MSETQTKMRPIAKVEEDLEDLDDSSDTKEEKPAKVKKEAPVIVPSKALQTKPDFIKQMKASANAYLNAVLEELKTVEPGHPHYGQLKFAKIRAERVIHSMNELGRDKPIR